MRIVDTLIVFRILKLLTTPWIKFDAFKLGLIDKNGHRLKDKKVESNDEKQAFSVLHRLVFNLKRILNKVPFGKTAFASYAVALLLLKEETNLDEEQMDELCEKFYHYIKKEHFLTNEMITETLDIPEVLVNCDYRLKRPLKEQNDTTYLAKTPIRILAEHSMVFGLKVYVGYIDMDRVLVTGDDLY
jgi:hypothetical protein